MSKTTPGASKASKTQADIREVMAKIHNKAHNQRPHKPGPLNRATPPVAASQTKTVPPIVQSAITPLQDDAFAKKIFFKHTNIADIVAEKLPERSEKTRQKHQLHLYQTYVQCPIMRISDPLHKLRFETRFWEGLFRMAIKLPLREDADYRILELTLSNAGMKKLCFVDMSRNNLLLENQQHVISLLQSRFTNWSGKLRKLPLYLQDYQKRREEKLENERKKLKQQIKTHGNVDWHKIAHMEDLILCELLGPIDKRTLFLWHTFAFDDDNLNKKYHVGKYYRDPVRRMPVKTMLEKIAAPELPGRTNSSLSSAPAPSVSSASPIVSQKRPIALAKPNELTFVPYDSSTQNQDVMRSWRTSHAQAQPVILQSPASTSSNDTANLGVAPDSIMEIDQDRENIDTTNRRTDQLVAKQSHIIVSAEKAVSANTGEQEPPLQRRISRDLQSTEEEAMDAAADNTTSSSDVAAQPTMGPPETRRCPTPPQIPEEEAMDVTASSSVVATQPTMGPPAKRTFPTPPPTINGAAMDGTANDSAASSLTCAQPGYTLEYVKNFTNIYSMVIKLRLAKYPKAPLTPLMAEKLVEKMYNHFYRESFARSELPPRFRKLNANEQQALKTKGPFAWAWEQLHTPIDTARSEPPVIQKPKTPVQKATAPDVQESTAAKANGIERSRESQEQTAERAVVQSKRQKNNVAFPRVRSTRPHNIVYESDTPSVTEPVFVGVDYEAAASQNQRIGTEVDPLYEQDATISFRPYVSSTQSQDGSSHPRQPDAPEETVPPASEPQQNTPTIDTLSEPDSLTFRPFVSSTQNQNTNSEHEQPVPTEEEEAPQALATTSTTPPAIPVADAANDPSRPTIKQERYSQQQDTSGYAGYVEEIPCPTQIYTIVDSEDDYREEGEAPCGLFPQNMDSIEQELNLMFSPMEALDARDGQILSYGRFNRLSIEQQMVCFAEGWKLIVDCHRKRQRPPVKDLCFTLAKAPAKSIVHPVAQPFDFLIDTNIESVRYTQHPIRWRGCNELQQNQLTVNLHHRTAGIFTVSVRDHQVGHLLGLLGPAQATSAGWEALTASLAHVGKFRYGRKEPTAEYYRMSVVEKVLYLYFDTLPSFPRDGGFVLRLDQDRSTFPAHGGTVNLERFNVNLHSEQRSISVRKDSNTTGQTEDDDGGLENFLMPGVAEAMAKLHKRIFHTDRS